MQEEQIIIKSTPYRHYADDNVEFDYEFNEKDETTKVKIDCYLPDLECNKDGNEFKMDEFINTYKDYYFLNCKSNNNNNENKPKKVNSNIQSCYEIESLFFDGNESIMQKNEWEPIDVFHILAWKTGNINHKDYKKNGLGYKRDWKKNKNDNDNWRFNIKLRSHSLTNNKFNNFAKEIIDIRNNYKNNIKTEDVWGKILEASKDINGLGTVYLITLLFFITQGEYPVYDRFAMASLMALLVREKVGCDVFKEGVIRNTTLSEKKNILGRSLSDLNLYNNYIQLLRHFFGEAWKGDKERYRDIDRALWVYGHYFDVPQ